MFCLTGRPGHYLQDEPVFAKKWNMYYEKQKAEAKDAYFAQCAVSGEERPLAMKSTARSKGCMEDLQQEVC